jgi:hypothetical protein
MKRADISTAEVLRAYRDRPMFGPWPTAILMEKGYPAKVAYAAMEREERRGFIEYGVSLRAGWLTPKGERELARIEQEESS